jgi:hypothetical protein
LHARQADQSDRRRAFERGAASLRPGGRFAWNAFAFDHRVAVELDDRRREEPMPHSNRFAVGGNRIDIVLHDGATSSLWWATKNEWLGLLDVAELELEALYGGFDGEPSRTTAGSTSSSLADPLDIWAHVRCVRSLGSPCVVRTSVR